MERNPIGKGIEVDLTDLYIDYFLRIVDEYHKFGTDPDDRAEHIFDILDEFDSVNIAIGNYEED